MRKAERVCRLRVALVAGLCLLPVRSADAYLNFSKAFLRNTRGDKSTDAQKSIAKEFARVKKCACATTRAR